MEHTHYLQQTPLQRAEVASAQAAVGCKRGRANVEMHDATDGARDGAQQPRTSLLNLCHTQTSAEAAISCSRRHAWRIESGHKEGRPGADCGRRARSLSWRLHPQCHVRGPRQLLQRSPCAERHLSSGELLTALLWRHDLNSFGLCPESFKHGAGFSTSQHNDLFDGHAKGFSVPLHLDSEVQSNFTMKIAVTGHVHVEA